MKAYVLHDIGDLRYEEVERPKLTEGTVLVRVAAVGICGSDIPRIYKTGAYSHPLIPGHEFAGTVEETGESADPAWKGRRVGVFPLIPCGECAQCKKRLYEMCDHYSYLGSRTDGGFAEYVRVPVWNLLELPEQVTFAQAAMLEPMSVAVHAIRRAQVEAADCVVICGLGTIGLLTVMMLRGMGYDRIYVIGNKDIQREKIKELGLGVDRFCDARKDSPKEWIKAATAGQGADVFFDCVGRDQVVEEAIECAAAGGRVMLVGNPASDMKLDKKVYWRILRRQLTLLGTWNSSFLHESTDDWHFALELLQRGSIHPERLITREYPLEKLYEGMERMRDKTEEAVKIMGIVQGDK